MAEGPPTWHVVTKGVLTPKGLDKTELPYSPACLVSMLITVTARVGVANDIH